MSHKPQVTVLVRKIYTIFYSLCHLQRKSKDTYSHVWLEYYNSVKFLIDLAAMSEYTGLIGKTI